MHSEQEGRARRRGAAAAVGPRPRVLDRRPRGTHPVRHARLPPDRAQREDRRRPSPGFGANGVVDLKLDDDQAIDPMNGEIGLHATPMVARNVVIVGAAGKTGANPKSFQNVKGLRPRIRRQDRQAAVDLPHDSAAGRVRQRDVGERVVGLHRQHRRLGPDLDRRGARPRVPARSRCRPATTTAAIGPGNGLFGESLVAVDLQTGKRKWHYQLVHHGIWDMDIPCAPILADITINGRTVKAVAQPTKQGVLYVFDRVTGQPIWPIEERPVAKGDVPGEWYSPTQPFPTKPPPYERTGRVDRRSDRLHAGASRRGGRAGEEVQDGPDVHAAGRQQDRRPARPAHEGARRARTGRAGRTIRRRTWRTSTRPARSARWASCPRRPGSPTCGTSPATPSPARG